MKILHIAGYKFTSLSELTTLQSHFTELLESLAIKGTILLSTEGININLAGTPANIQQFQMKLKTDNRFNDISFHQTTTDISPYKRLKVRIRNEIITMRQANVDVVPQRPPAISPKELKQWLDEKRDFTLLDTRNDYEVKLGSFTGAIDLGIQDFSEFPEHSAQLAHDKPIVMFCTGGIRCEKAALYLQHQGYENVYQLDGGIIGYFTEVGREHYTGDCFVFDDRGTV